MHDEDGLSEIPLPLHKQQGFWWAASLGLICFLFPIGLVFAGPIIEALTAVPPAN